MVKLLTSSKYNITEIFTCECSNSRHHLIVEFEEFESNSGYLTFVDQFVAHGFFDRIKQAIRILVGRAIYCGEIILSKQNMADFTRAILQCYINDSDDAKLNTVINELLVMLGTTYEKENSEIT